VLAVSTAPELPASYLNIHNYQVIPTSGYSYISRREEIIVDSPHLTTTYMASNDLLVWDVDTWDLSDCYYTSGGSLDCNPNLPLTLLSITPSAPAQVAVNHPYVISLTLENQGDFSINNLTLSLPLTDTLAYVAGGTMQNNQLEWSVGSLASGQQVVLTATVKATQGDLVLSYPRYRVQADPGVDEVGSPLPVTTIGPAPQLVSVKYYQLGSQKVAMLQ